jgi:transposase
VNEGRGDRSGKRQFRSVDLKRQIVEETLSGETSVAVVARRHGVNANQVFSWRRQYHRGELIAGPEGIRQPALLAVQVQQSTTALRPEIHRADEVPAVADPDCLEIEFSGGRQIRIWGRADLEVLRAVIRELAQS